MRKTDRKKTFIDYELPTKDLEQVRGGREKVTTLAEGEEGGTVTTQALGEEGGCGFTTEAVGEEGGTY
ncbi:hypothetical protein JRI60_15805 [Archangium violaceum]|uniref:hypothetical protein n=1 Tax=Archangium violaceum TaxID=83451 RepID=UPI00194DE810|nr:hypothetical protein [Archangium violaceum]QRO00385.1 hypothetical protein JRI60_15805 [Archangium violaceum]